MKIYNLILTHFILPISEFVFAIPLTKEIASMDKITQLSSIEIENYQKDKLEKLLKYATENSVYYKKLEITAVKNNPIEFLKSFPILTKSILKENTDILLTEPKINLLKNGSSGSTGEQTIVYWSKKEQTVNRATQLLWWKWGKYTIGDRLIQTGITPSRTGLKKYKDFFFRTTYIQAFSHNAEEIACFLKSLNPKKEYILAGYASSLFVFSKIAKENNINIKIKSAISWGDKLFAHYKIAIQDAFGCTTYESYGSAEGFMIGAQKDLDYLYIMSPNVFVEIVDDNGNEIEDGKLGNIVVTNLNGFAMPLIRYQIGDLAIKLPMEKYPKDRELNLPLFEKIIGRDTDIVKTPSGNYLIVHSFTGIFEHIAEIKQFCVVQNNLCGITILYVKDSNFKPAILTAISEKIKQQLNEPFEISFEEVQKINATPSGKPQLIISNLKKN
jgi:phenylacetate-CoA ligase